MSTKAAYHHGNLKAALIAAGLKEITQHGIEGFSLRGVARRAGVSAPAVYRHFADKDDLVAAMAMEAWERLMTMIADGVAKAPPAPLEQFRANGVAIVRFAVAHPEHFRVICIPYAFDRAPADFRAKWKAAEEGNRQALADAQAQGVIAQLPLEQLMLAANALVMGLAHQIIEGRLGNVDDKRATELANAVTQVLGVGLIPREGDTFDPTLGKVVKGTKKKR
ncbi:MAG: TetR/AcrR family transcriptional regulator [Kofleriaceae bacterium]